MSAETKTFTISDTTPASASTAVGDVINGLAYFDEVTIHASLVGATGGTLDVYLQRKIAADTWVDWCHFAQLASGASAVRFTVPMSNPATSATVAVGIGTDAAPGVALAANTFIGGHPGNTVRAVYVAGASTSAGAAVVIRLACRRRPSA